jgi:hypothetical protein
MTFKKKSVVALLLIAIALFVTWLKINSPLPLDSKKIAAAETSMWQAYYSNQPSKLGKELIALLRHQFGLSLLQALSVSKDLMDATLTFNKSQGDYNNKVLPHLVKAYEKIRKARNENWDADDAAKAELEWWVARRTPGKNSPEQVGHSIARLYTILYGKSNPDIERAGYLRAKAASIRDSKGLSQDSPEWKQIHVMLEESYDTLIRGVN